MKRLLISMFIISLTAGCSLFDDTPTIEVSEDPVIITIPMAQQMDDPDFKLETYAKQQGFDEVVVDADSQTMTVVFNGKNYATYYRKHRRELDDQLEAMPYVTSIEASTYYEKVSIEVEKSGYEKDRVQSLATPIMLFQIQLGKKVSSHITVIDKETQTVLDDIKMPEGLLQ